MLCAEVPARWREWVPCCPPGLAGKVGAWRDGRADGAHEWACSEGMDSAVVRARGLEQGLAGVAGRSPGKTPRALHEGALAPSGGWVSNGLSQGFAPGRKTGPLALPEALQQ